MRKILAAIAAGILVAAALASAQPGTVAIRLQLVDEGGRKIPGIVRILPADPGNPSLPLPELLERMIGLGKIERALGWHVLPVEGGTVDLPSGQFRIEALSGLETLRVERKLDLDTPREQEIILKLPAVFHPDELGLAAGNTHLHLKNLTRAAADRYLAAIPAADRLKVLFTSYLERVPDDKTYISNQYPLGDLKQFTGLLVNNGEEHRHNFKGFGEGYGHVMFLNIRQLIRPVSIGPGIMAKGFDDLPLAPGINEARRQGGTVLWCHNTFGHEDVLNVLQGRIDALNVFDGSQRGTFEDNYYRYLNVGVRLPISTGTDWFQYDFSRVYVEVKQPLTIPNWLDALKQGRNQATNGPLLSLSVNGQKPGTVLNLEKPGDVRVELTAVGRGDFEQLQLIHNGKVLKTVTAKGLPFRAEWQQNLRIDEPGWLAARIRTKNKNELNQELFAHTSPVYVDLAGKRTLRVEDGLELVRQLEEGREAIAKQGIFSESAARDRMLKNYDQGIAELRRRFQ